MAEGKKNLPRGNDFLSVVGEQERRCGEDFDKWLPTAGVKAPQTLDSLGTALSYLDQIASCRWGCGHVAHIEERLVGRVTSNARAALRLLRSGYYDESLGLARQIGETANLLSLFVQSKGSHEHWKNASKEEIRRDFSPARVRQWLEGLKLPLPMNKDTYGTLSGQSVHVNPSTSPQSHNPYDLPTLGGYFQKAGALVTLNHLGGMVGWVLWLAVLLIKPPTERRDIVEASVYLLRSVGGVNLHSIQDRFGEIRESLQFRRETARLTQLQKTMRIEREG